MRYYYVNINLSSNLMGNNEKSQSQSFKAQFDTQKRFRGFQC